MIDVCNISSLVVNALETDSAVVLAVVVVFKVDADSSIVTQIFTVESIAWTWTVFCRDEVVRVFYYPVAVHTSVVWYHVGSKADSPLPATPAQIFQCRPSAKVSCDLIVQK